MKPAIQGRVNSRETSRSADLQKENGVNGVTLDFGILSKLLKRWSGRRGSNPRRPAWEAGILPLNYSRG